MSCCNRNNNVTVTHVMEFMRDELLYDIKNVAYVVADTLKTEDEHDRHQVFDIGEDGNVDRVTRVMNLSFAEVVEWLQRFTRLEVGRPCNVSPNGVVTQKEGCTCKGAGHHTGSEICGGNAIPSQNKGVPMTMIGGYQDNEFEAPEEYMVICRVPGSTSITTLTLLKELIHEYVIECVLEDWLGITAVEVQPIWTAKKEATKEKILHYRNMGKKVRITTHPW